MTDAKMSIPLGSSSILDKAFLPPITHADLREVARSVISAWFTLANSNLQIPFTIYNDLKIYLEEALDTLQARGVVLRCYICGGPVLDEEVKWGEVSQGESRPFCGDCY